MYNFIFYKSSINPGTNLTLLLLFHHHFFFYTNRVQTSDSFTRLPYVGHYVKRNREQCIRFLGSVSCLSSHNSDVVPSQSAQSSRPPFALLGYETYYTYYSFYILLLLMWVMPSYTN